PNPMNPPQYFDLPTKDGVVQPLIAAKWVANSPLVMVDQYVPNLKQYRAIAMDVGNEDPLGAANKDLDLALTRLGISHTFEVYEGNHTNRVRERFETKVIQFFAHSLTFLTDNCLAACPAVSTADAWVQRHHERRPAPERAGLLGSG